MTGTRAALLATVVSVGVFGVAWAQLPSGARIGPGGVRAELSVPDAEGGIWRLRAYRPERPSNSPNPARGEIDLCLAVDKGGKRWHGIVCGITAGIALQLHRRGLRTDCGGVGHVIGEPAPPSPTCGLVASDVEAVTVTADGYPPQAAALSEPFDIRVNRSKRVLKRAGLDPKRVRALPPVLTLRAFLGFVNTTPTDPGERSPRITVAATRAGGGVLSRTFGGDVTPTTAPPQPSFRPPPGAPRVRLSEPAPDDRPWKSLFWRAEDGGLCARVRAPSHNPVAAVGCQGRHSLVGQLLRRGAIAYTGYGPGPLGYAVYGFAHGAAAAVDVIGPGERIWSAKLSPVWTSVRRGRQTLRVRAFLAVLSGKPPVNGQRVEVRTTLSNGHVLTREP